MKGFIEVEVISSPPALGLDGPCLLALSEILSVKSYYDDPTYTVITVLHDIEGENEIPVNATIEDIKASIETVENEKSNVLSSIETIVDEMKMPDTPLRELGKFIQVKTKPGDHIFMPYIWDGVSGIAALKVLNISITPCELAYHTYLGDSPIQFREKYNRGVFHDIDFGVVVFTDPAAAAARLAELKETDNA